MLDPKLIRSDPDTVRARLARRGDASSIAALDEFLGLDQERRKLLVEVEDLKAERNRVSAEIAKTKSSGGDAQAMIEEMRSVGDRVKGLDDEVRSVDEKLSDILLNIPNTPHDSVPDGTSEDENVERPGSRWGEPREFDFEPKPHWEIGEALGILDFERGVKIAGSRSYVTKGLGCRLVRSLIDFMIDVHTSEHGYTEVSTPYLVLRECMIGTGQLPKFEFDMYRTDPDDLFLIPTSEVPVTNLHRDEILEPGTLPLNYVCYSANFRREAGAAGRETRGLIRVHQFDKVELVKFCEPEKSYEEYARLTDNACAIFRKLELPHRIMDMCAGDVGFKASIQCDPEAWFPGQGKYIEVSSCSNFEDFQARRAGIRYRPERGAKPRFVHTLNGSGLAVGRTFAAILENYQEADGSVAIPSGLIPYMHCDRIGA
jgi:seryl-tRNA synthetase